MAGISATELETCDMHTATAAVPDGRALQAAQQARWTLTNRGYEELVVKNCSSTDVLLAEGHQVPPVQTFPLLGGIARGLSRNCLSQW
ncbi:TPA: hypothetical protein ACH3X3_005509 [Trebouxia sp. C0006]